MIGGEKRGSSVRKYVPVTEIKHHSTLDWLLNSGTHPKHFVLTNSSFYSYKPKDHYLIINAINVVTFKLCCFDGLFRN